MEREARFRLLVNVHADHLNTPRVITRPFDNAVVWKNDNTEPFGNSQPDENPSGLGTFQYNLRFPGQYWDAETGTHYNWARDYDPRIGRYSTSDPIGLKGGINTYAYVGGNPLTFGDPTGEAVGGLLLGLELAWEGYSLNQEYDDGRDSGKWYCEKIVKVARKIKQTDDDFKKFELQAELDLNKIQAMQNVVLKGVGGAPGAMGSVPKDSYDAWKKFRLPIRGPLTAFLLSEIAKNRGKKRGMEDCGCGDETK